MTPNDGEHLVRRLVGGDPAAATELRSLATTSTAPLVLAAAALVDPGDPALLARAAAAAVRPLDRQIVALAAAHLAGDGDRVTALAREHLLDHPDSVIAAWLAAGAPRPTPSRSTTPTHPQEMS